MQIISTWRRVDALPPIAKAGIVVAGYAAALLFAAAAVWLHYATTSGPDRDASSGMHAFGDAMGFIAGFCMASSLPTGLALLFLRRSRPFWYALCGMALAVACTGLAAAALVAHETHQGILMAGLDPWVMLTVPRILIAPFVAATFGLAALLAPWARLRWSLAAAALAEGITSLYGFVHWLMPVLFR